MKISVLEVLPTLKRAGAERMVVSLVSGLDRDRFEPAVVSLYDAFPAGFEAELEERGIPVWHLGKRPGLDLRMYPRLMKVFRDFKPAVVHTHSYVLRYTWPVTKAAKVHTVHNLASKEVDFTGRLIHRAAFRTGVAAVAVGGEVARSFREFYGFEPAATILNGIETPRCSARQQWRAANGFGEDDVLIVSVARLDPQKNPLGLIEAFARAGCPRCHLLMVGDGSLRCSAPRVHFLGVRTDVAEILSSADIFALASHWEGTPLSVMEAMAAGLPVVATRVGGVPELVEHGTTGLLVAPGDMQSFAAALAAVARDPQRRRELGEAARNAAARFSVTAMVASYSRLFERLAGRAVMTARVVLLTTNLARGGAETQVAQLALALRRRGWTISVISMVRPSAFESELAAAGVPVFSLDMQPGSLNPLPLARLASLMRKLRPHVLHSHMFHANILARAIRLIFPVPVVISTAHSLIESSRRSPDARRREWLYRVTDKLADATVCVSAAGAERYAAIGAASAKRLRVIPNSVDTTRFRPEPGATRERRVHLVSRGPSDVEEGLPHADRGHGRAAAGGVAHRGYGRAGRGIARARRPARRQRPLFGRAGRHCGTHEHLRRLRAIVGRRGPARGAARSGRERPALCRYWRGRCARSGSR